MRYPSRCAPRQAVEKRDGSNEAPGSEHAGKDVASAIQSIRWALIAALLLIPVSAVAGLRAVDGDTLVETTTGERIRVMGVDTPELRARCAAEAELAQRAKAMTGWLLLQGAVVHRTGRLDKYGRTLAYVEIPGVGDLGTALIRAGVGRDYHGGHREGWC